MPVPTSRAFSMFLESGAVYNFSSNNSVMTWWKISKTSFAFSSFGPLDQRAAISFNSPYYP